MSVRRVIYTGQDAVRANFEKVRDLLQDLVQSGQVEGTISDVQLNNLTRLLVERGISLPEVSSIAKQYEANTNVPLEVHLIGGEEAVRYAMQAQHAATGYVDTPNAPNFSIRFPSEAELILRRQTLGSLCLIHAAHLTQVQRDDTYGLHFGKAFLVALGCPHIDVKNEDHPLAMLYATGYLCYEDKSFLDHYLSTRGEEYAGANFGLVRVREDDRYVDRYQLTIDYRRMALPTLTASMLACRIIAEYIDRHSPMTYVEYRNRILTPLKSGLQAFSKDKVVHTNGYESEPQQNV